MTEDNLSICLNYKTFYMFATLLNYQKSILWKTINPV